MIVKYNIFHCAGHTNACIASAYRKLCWTFELFLLSDQTLVILQFSTFENTFIVLIVTWQFDDAELWMINNIWGLIIFSWIDEGGFHKPLVRAVHLQNIIPLE